MTSTHARDDRASSTVSVTVETPRQPEVIELLRLGTAFAQSLYPPESNFLLDVEELDRPGISVYVARNEGGRAIGMAALVPWGVAVTELKRMFVRDDARGQGVGTRLLERIEADARAAGLRQIVLETGTLHTDAQALYARCGYSAIPQFGQYISEKHSYCMARMLSH
ncbi:MAG TPA: GNAT family N-acetyltransferase [Mycetocola sp.]|jgi:putative acetyltransferase|uniref:GNAT family N-acetyltransferase n=1 Tax=Mycetocola sp. TaxID=1871042 RepID=UPI00260866F0|nr:GNAT family N-acetyltransferase [Mycetocola sp.]MCU1561251.1 family N-acetyltransferase [Mycetocola sp.]HEV7848478.1 GNAT family N-acetyltransferase [Mycetocola sp.]